MIKKYLYMFVDVIFPSIKNKQYTYRVDSELPKIGSRVIVPLGNRKETGFVISIKEKCELKNVKAIIQIVDKEVILTNDLWDLAKWVSEYYFSDFGETLKAFFPKETKISHRKIISLKVDSLEKALSLIQVKTKGKLKVLQELFIKGKIELNTLKKNANIKNINNIIKEFEELEIISSEILSKAIKKKTEKIITLSEEYSDKNKLQDLFPLLTEKQSEQLLKIVALTGYGKRPLKLQDALKKENLSASVINSLIKKNILIIQEKEIVRKDSDSFPISEKEIILNEYQKKAVQEIIEGIDSNNYKAFFLYGITGSGKTQVYIEAIKHVIAKNKSAIVLVPEISLTPQLVQRFRNHFGDSVTVIHSKMSAGERYDSWRLIVEGKYKIVIGARSAIFAPVKDLGIIIVDEEHESSYKQFDMNPRYNGRDTAIMRAFFAKATIVLGSATPSIESFYNAKSGKYKLLELPIRADGATLPEIKVVSISKSITNKDSVISEELKEKISEKLSLNQKVILLQNHRGFSTIARCLNCGYVEVCDNCNVTLTYHRTKKHLRCHYCGYVKPISELCPKCNGVEKEFSGIGTQKVEEELKKLFPESKILRMDLDTTTRKGSHSKILKDFGEGKADILLGTQMVAKGLDFAKVTLVGVILADVSLHFPDFRATERTVQLLTQVAGRAGRSDLKGEVIIQTYQPSLKCFEFIKTHNFIDYYKNELIERKNLYYPPFGRLILIEFKGVEEQDVVTSANKFMDILKSIYQHLLKKVGRDFCKIMGPAPAIISKINNRYRYHIIIKILKDADPSYKITRFLLEKAISNFEKNFEKKDIKFIIDVDPQGLM